MELKINDIPPTICLNMIVKNESHIIRDTLEKLCNKINFSYWVICDTGSTDNTREIIADFFMNKDIPGELHNHEWKNFAHNRTIALNEAFNKTDLLFIFDADDDIHGNITMPKIVDNDGYLLNFGLSDGISYQRILLVNNKIRWSFKSVIHEYINCLKPDPKITTLQGDYYVVSGRSGSRNSDPEKYLKDAKILEEAYYEAKKDNDDIYMRYAFYCANSYKDCGKQEDAIKWYKITLNNNNWSQEKYICCLNLFNIYNNLGEKEKSLYYLVESFNYDLERMECVSILIKDYCIRGYHKLAYNYYRMIKDFYENNYIQSNNNNKLFVENDKANFFLPYYMILVSDKVKDTYPEAKQTIIKMYEIVFTKKHRVNDDFYIGNLLYNLQFFIEFCVSSDKFISLFKDYILFLEENIKINLYKYEFLKKFEKYEIKFKSFEQPKPLFTEDECKKSNKILIYTGFSNLNWNYTYSLNNALGGSETAVANLIKSLPNNFEIFVGGAVSEEKIDNIHFVNLDNLKNLVKKIPFYTVIVSRYIGFYEMFPETSFYRSFIWGHDITLYHYGCNLDVSSILKKWSSKINGCICQTKWHKNLFIEQYPQLNDKIFTINNGILVDKFIHKPIKIINRFIYTSCAERGLDRLLELWPSIIDVLPDAELFISSYNKFPQNDYEKQLDKIIKNHESIKHVGCLNKYKLYELMSSSEFWLYPTNFNETSCITAMEMLMSDVICLYYPIAGLVDTLGDYGITVERGNELNTILNLSTKQKYDIRQRGKKYALSCSWANRANEWINLFYDNYNNSEELKTNMIQNGTIIETTNNIDIIIKYGTKEKNIDITKIVLDKLTNNNNIYIPSDDNYRASLFSDPIYGVLKKIFITDLNDTILKTFEHYQPVQYSINRTFNKHFIKVVNIKRHTERKNIMLEQFKKENIQNFEIIEAIDGKELEETLDLALLFKDNNFNNRKGVIGCALSHLKIWDQLCNDSDNNFYVILEDDVQLCDDFKNKLNQHCILFQKHDADHLSLGINHVNHQAQIDISDDQIKIFKKDVYKFWNITYAYIISKNAAKKIINFINKCAIKCACDNPRSYGDILTHYHTTQCIVDHREIAIVGSDTSSSSRFEFNFDNKDVLKISFCDWWNEEYCGGFFDFNNNFITDILKYSSIKNILVVKPNENPDILFYSIFGSEHQKYTNIRKIFYSGEPFSPRNDADFNLTFDKTDIDINNFRYPLWLSYTNDYLIEECNRRKYGTINVPKRTKFCSFISNGECKTTCRREIVEKLSKYKRVDCGGKYLNNIGYTVPRGTNCSGKIEHNLNYKFAIAFENEDYPGYVTEKICDIYKSNCIPIYWGNKEVLEDFNPKTFIYAKDFENFDELVEYIIKVDNDDELYASYFKEPFFSNMWLDMLNDPYKTFYKNLSDLIIGKNNLYTNFINKYNDKICIYSPAWVYNLLEDYINNLKTRYDITFVISVEQIKTINPNKILCVNNIFDTSILDIFKDKEISILNIDSLIIPYFLEGLLSQNYLYPNIKIYDYSKTNIDIANKNNMFNTKLLDYTYDDKEVEYLRKINNQEKIYDFGIIEYNKEMSFSSSTRRKVIVDILTEKGFTVHIICGFGQSRDNELGKCKIILNIHQQCFKEIECRTFEHLRCNRLLYANYNVLSEFSFIENSFILRFKNLKFIKYSDFKNITRKNIDNFDFEELEIDKNNNIFSNCENNYKSMALENMVNSYLTDKNSSHSYLQTYHNILKSRRFSSKNILEVGVERGGSLKLWNDYFINAYIYGLDMDSAPDFLKLFDRIKTFECSAYSSETIDMFNKQNIYFDMILDDGPHTLLSMNYFLIHYSKLLAPNGILIIEDIPSMDWALLFKKIVDISFKEENSCIYDLRPNKNRCDDIIFTFTNTTDTYGCDIFSYNVYYGIDNNKIDITHLILTSLLNENLLVIPLGDDSRCKLFNLHNHCPEILKNIYIYNKKTKQEIIIPHDQEFTFDLFDSSINTLSLDLQKNKNIHIYNIWHNKLFDHCYEELDEHSLNDIIMYDVNPKYNKVYNKDKNFNIVREYELDIYDKTLQETNYCQTSCLYHVFLNNLYKDLDYIGFIQYDMVLDKDFIYDIQNIIKNGSNDTYFYSLLVANKIDVKYICNPYPNSILEKYNTYFNTSHSYDSIKNHIRSKDFICLHTFVIPIHTYTKMMKWYCSIHDSVNKNYLDNIYQESISEVTEEIFGLFLLLQMIEDETIQLKELKLNHEWPSLHNLTEWDNYKVRIPSNVLQKEEFNEKKYKKIKIDKNNIDKSLNAINELYKLGIKVFYTDLDKTHLTFNNSYSTNKVKQIILSNQINLCETLWYKIID
jgi:GR25 family glycosyltransferase involved in LPS biosynthesis